MSRIYINNDWLFAENFKDEYKSGVIDSNMKNIRIPHSTRTLPFNYFSEEEYQMLSAYRKVIFAPEEWKNKRVLVTFEGAAHYAELFLNGEKIGEHYSGYTAFTIELTGKLKLGEENILLVKLDSRENLNIPPFGNVIDYMTYGGIYRDVYIDIKEQCYIADVFAKPEFTGKIVSDIVLNGELPSNAKIRQTATFISSEKTEAIVLGEREIDKNEFSVHGFIRDIKIWDINTPNRYLIKTELIANGKVIDTHEVKVGFRSAIFTNEGFFLNGRRVQIRGLNRHQSYAYVGYAMPESMQRDDARVLKELGVNAVRTSHYPQSHYFIDECDKLGILVFTEIPGWQHIGDNNWKNQAIKNVEEMVVQYRNHPSIVIWGVRINESGDDHDFYVRTNEVAHQLDPTRQTGGVRNFRKSEFLEDVYTYNDFIHDGKKAGCEPKKNITSNKNKPYLITENNGHMFPTKSFDNEEHRLEHALRHARVLNDVASHPDICGSFSWCMADYNTHKDFGSGDRICYHGVTDMFRNHKMAAAVYKSQDKVNDVLEVSSSMDIGEHPASIKGNVWIFTNADSVKMYKNDKFIKEYVPHNKHFEFMVNSPILIDDYIGNLLETEEKMSPKKAKYVACTLNYIGLNGYTKITPKLAKMALKCLVVYRLSINKIVNLYTKYVGDWGGKSTVYRFEAIKDGKVVKTVTKTPMTKMNFEIDVPNTVLSEKTSYDVGVVRIRAIDENVNLLPYSNEAIKLTVEGPLEIIGPDIISLRGGMTAFYVKTVAEKGKAMVKITSPYLKDKTVEFDII
ncbi:MAG: glycoside hydrolase family 2 protein [Clostridia bacterium]|nr:glycoside hydrolase family 2 protein [Clostridia bacterium]